MANGNKADQGSPKDVLHKHGKTFKSTMWLGNLGCDGSLTHEGHLCSPLSCSACFWSSGSAGAQQVCTQPKQRLQVHRCAGKTSFKMPGGRQCPEEDRTGTVGGRRNPSLPKPSQAIALSPPLTTNSSLSPERGRISPSLEMHSGFAWPTRNHAQPPPKAVFSYLWCLQCVHQRGLCMFTPRKITERSHLFPHHKRIQSCVCHL